MRFLKTVSVLALVLCTSSCVSDRDDSPTPGEALLEVARNARERVDTLAERGVVMSPRLVRDVLDPLDDATQAFADSTAAWIATSEGIAHAGREAGLMIAASAELVAVMNTLDIHIPVVNSEGEYVVSSEDFCPVVEEPVPTIPDQTTANLGDAYWLRYACRAGCATAQVACTAGCAALIVPPLTPLSPGILLCMAGCTAAGAICQDACSGICNR